MSRHKVARLVKKGTLKSEKLDLDERVVLLDMEDLRHLKEGLEWKRSSRSLIRKAAWAKAPASASVAAELAQRGHQTLLIDADPQANATAHFLSYENVTVSIGDVLVKLGTSPTVPLKGAIVETEIEQLDLVPSSIKFSNFEKEPSIAISRLRTHLDTLKDEYEYVIIDTPPTLGQILTTFLLASTHMLIPVSAHPLAQDGVQYLMHTFKQVCGLNQRLKLLGIVRPCSTRARPSRLLPTKMLPGEARGNGLRHDDPH